VTAREAFATALAVVFAAFDKPLAPAALEAYWLALSDLTEAELAGATKQALQECKFLPSPAELRAYAGRLKIETRAVMAWDVVRATIDKLDYTGSPDFGPLVNAVVRNLGGWPRLCALTLPQLVWARKDFERVFAMLALLDTDRLNGHPLQGGSDYVTRITIPGEAGSTPRVATPIGATVRRLADAKS